MKLYDMACIVDYYQWILNANTGDDYVYGKRVIAAAVDDAERQLGFQLHMVRAMPNSAEFCTGQDILDIIAHSVRT